MPQASPMGWPPPRRRLLSMSDDFDGIDGGRDCPTCGAPLIPEHVADDSLALAWTCPTHGIIDMTPDPFNAG